MSFAHQWRQVRVLALETLEQQVKQFRRHEDIWPFRVPHQPLDLDALLRAALADAPQRLSPEELRSRYVMTMRFPGGHAWESWAITLPSGIHVYCDSDTHEHRLLASAKRGSAVEADRFFLELLAETRGHCFGIELEGAAPEQVRTPIDDRDLLADVFVELFEGTEAEANISRGSGDFREDVAQWLKEVLIAPEPSARGKRMRRFREERE